MPDKFEKWIATAEDDSCRSYRVRKVVPYRCSPDVHSDDGQDPLWEGMQSALMLDDGTPLSEIDNGTLETRTRPRFILRLIGEWTSEQV